MPVHAQTDRINLPHVLDDGQIRRQHNALRRGESDTNRPAAHLTKRVFFCQHDERRRLLFIGRVYEMVKSPWLTPEDAAAYLSVALGTLRNWTSARYVPFARRGRVVRYHRDALDRWLEKGSCNGRTTFSDGAPESTD